MSTPTEVSIVRLNSGGRDWHVRIEEASTFPDVIGGHTVASFRCQDHAEWYANMLRLSAVEQRKALA